MKNYNKILEGQSFYKKIDECISKGRMPVKITGTAESQKLHLAFSLCEKYSKGMVFVCEGMYSAKKLWEKLSFFTDKALFYPEKEYIFYETFARGDSQAEERVNVLGHLCRETCFLVTTVSAMCQKIPSKEDFEFCSLSFKRGDIYQIESITAKLTKMGYKREANVEGMGQFAVRGGIIDIFPIGSKNAYRLDFFDEEIDAIKIFDVDSQTSIDVCDGFEILPASENFAKKNSDLTDYIKDMFVFVDEPNACKESLDSFTKDLGEAITAAIEDGVKLKNEKKEISYYMTPTKEVIDKLCEGVLFTVTNFALSDKFITSREIVAVTGRNLPAYDAESELLIEDITYFISKGYRIVLPCGSEKGMQKIAEILDSEEIPYNTDKEMTKEILPFTVTLTKGILSDGFEYADIPAAFLCINGSKMKTSTETRKVRRKKNGLKSIYDITEGDAVVHDIHGIGIYKGMHQLTVDGITKDYLKIKYKGTDLLYVPVQQLNLLSKYVGGAENIKINKLGGEEWSNAKARVRQNVQEMAKELLELYAKRESTKGYAFGPDTELQEEFESTFPYEETEDQLKAIENVKFDMESIKPMDRLICGDVGYGKTEIAMRGAFKAVSNGKQVAVLVPTTLLAKQHYENFLGRMEQFAVNVEMLSRFRNTKQQKEIKEKLKSGKIDIIIGTHSILQKDIVFKDLGLLVIDEEQRFGVAHKEKIKNLKCNVDVITLSATPIPRTLNMAMSGLRDMSVLNDPPKNRKPVQTYVMEYNEPAVRNAILKEIGRSGQVYYLHNRVENIDIVESKLKKLVPEARFVTAHGKMGERELENIMLSVINGEVDVLICTTIIETGIDIPNINTLIIENSERFGLAQLYQLRGRIGRSSRLAHAYLTIPKNKVLDEAANKRLMAIKEFTEFGSGIKIAMRDLEIRGAGSLLGANQHGYMNRVGYDMYCKLLESAVRQIKNNEPVQEEVPLTIDLSLNCYIPDTYIEDKITRIEMYRSVASMENEKDKLDIIDEFIDRFGDIPKEVVNLIEVTEIRNIAKELGFGDISQKGTKLFITLTSNSPVEAVTNYVVNNRLKAYMTSGKKIMLVYSLEGVKMKDICSNIKIMLHDIKSLKN